MNTITIADIKRGGMSALDAALNRGVTTIMKRNRPAAVVLTPLAYEALLARSTQASPTVSALDWLLQPAPTEPTPALDGAAMAQRLNELHTDWPDR